MRNPNYCGTCYSAAEKAGRPVRMTDVYPYPVCDLCERHLRNGLIHYRPSNGTEYCYFVEQCDRCRHNTDDRDNPKPGRLRPPFTACTWGVHDRLLVAMAAGYDSVGYWFDPADLEPGCPATCKRFTPKDYGYDDRDPPRPDVPGQMNLGETLTVAERAVGEKATATP